MGGFFKYEFNNELLGSVTLFRVTLGILEHNSYIYIYIKDFFLDKIFKD